MFVHLHNHTEYSLLDGLNKVSDKDGNAGAFILRAKELGMPALAITDHGNLFGIIDFYKQCKANGIKPIIGCEFYVATQDRLLKSGGQSGSNNHLILIAKNLTGYKNLIKLASLGYTEGFYYKPRIDETLLEQYHEGLICMSACIAGRLPRLLLDNKLEEARDLAMKYKALFGEDYYIEIQDHNLPEEKIVMPMLIGLADQLGIQLVATNDAHYTDASDAEVQEILLCIGTRSTLADPNHFKFSTNEFYLKTESEMAEIFQSAPQAIANTVVIADKCEDFLDFGTIKYPVYALPLDYAGNQDQYLRELVYQGLKARNLDTDKRYTDQADYELKVISDMHLPSYFLLVWDIIHYADTHNIAVGPGRGSAAGSLVVYALGITRLDPLKHGLLFERFLNAGRASSLPDIDLDFDHDKREDILTYIRTKYGEDHVCHIITFGTMGAKAVIRDVGRVLGVSLADIDLICSKINVNDTLASVAPQIPMLKKYQQLADVSLKLEGLVRHASRHASGILITEKPLIETIPLAIQTERVVSQFYDTIIADFGLLKIDVLGLKTLTVMDKCKRDILAINDEDLNYIDIDINDSKVYDLICSGKTLGCFQIETSAMQKLCQQLQPQNMEELAVIISLDRPGVLRTGMVEAYINRKQGREPVAYMHELVKPITISTLGVVIYQEQVINIAKDLADFNLQEADMLRSALGKKDEKKLATLKQQFIANASVKIGVANAEAIYETLKTFSTYLFNRSHALAYAYLAYYTAYLKCYYPTIFMAQTLNMEVGDKEDMALYIYDAINMDIQVLPPSVNHGTTEFCVEGERSIRYPLSGIKGVGSKGSDATMANRGDGYLSLEDYIARNGKSVTKRDLVPMALTGAFSEFDTDRHAMLEQVLALKAIKLKPGETYDVSPQSIAELEEEYIGFPLSFMNVLDVTADKKMHANTTIKAIQDDNTERGGLSFIARLLHVERRVFVRDDMKIVSYILTVQDNDRNCTVTINEESYLRYKTYLSKYAILLLAANTRLYRGMLYIKCTKIGRIAFI